MRQLTAFASYFDNFGDLLIGRACFYNSDKSPSVVYAWDNSVQRFVENGNIVFTNSSGQLEPQVFLDNHDYLIVFEKYVGDGRMTEDNDRDSWQEQGSAIDKFNTIGIELSGGAIRAVSTIDDLRQTQGLAVFEVIELMGYYESGDKPIVYYKWNPYISSADDGGSIIKVEDVASGRWELVSCPEYLDVRHFGAFPMQGIEENARQRSDLTNAYTYAHSQGCGVYFWADDTHAYYDISGANLIKVDSNPTARLFCVDNINGTSISNIKEVHLIGEEYGELATGLITLQGEVVRTSWGEETDWVVFDPSVKLIMDAAISTSTPRTWEGIEVEILAYTSGCVFTDCLITSNGKIDQPVTIADCEIKQEWFDENYNWGSLTSYQNDIRFKNFKDANAYIIVKNKQNEADYGDLEGKTISNIVLLADCTLENAVFSTVALQGSSSLMNISGAIVLQGASVSHNWVDCWLEVTAFAGSISSFSLLRGSFKSSLTITISGDASFEDAKIESLIFVRGKLTMYDCRILEDMQAYELQMSQCDVMATVGIVWYNGYLKGSIQCNRFLSSGYLAVNPGLYFSGAIDCKISITGNYSDHDFWDDIAFVGVTHGATGKIVYEGNYGGCPGNRVVKSEALEFKIKNASGNTPLPSQDDNTIWLIDDRRTTSGAARQLWWRLVLNKTLDFDELGVWRCKYLNYSRYFWLFTKVLADFGVDGSSMRYQFNFEKYRERVELGRGHSTKTLSGSYLFQQDCQVVNDPDKYFASWVAQGVSNAEQLIGSIDFTLEAI